MLKRSLYDQSGRWAKAFLRSSWRYDLILLAFLFVLGAAAAQLHVRIPHTPVYIEGRWAFGYMGFALLGRWWLALLLAAGLSVASPAPQVSIGVVLFGNMLYAVPSLVLIRLAYRRFLVRLIMPLCGLGWVVLILFCYETFNTPLTMGLVAYLDNETFWSGMRHGWSSQPYLLESVLVAIVSALGVLLFRSHMHLSESRRELGITLDSIGDGVIATDAEGRVQRMNPVAERLTGWPIEQARGRKADEVFDIVNAHSGEKVLSPVERVLAEGVVVGLANHTRLISRDGRQRQIADSAAPVRDTDGRLIGVVMVFRDVTEEYSAREALRESDRRYRELFEGSRDGFVMVDPTGRIVDANRAFCGMLGYSLPELRAMDDFYTVTPERWRQWEREEIWERRLLKQGYSDIYEKEYVCKDGSIIPVELQSYAVRDEEGHLQYLWGVVRDLTARRETQKALIESEHHFRSFVENANDIVYELDPDGTFTYISPNWQEFMGEPADCAIGETFHKYVHPEDVDLCSDFLRRVLSTGRRQSTVEYRVRRADGEWRWHVSNGSPLRDPQGRVVRYVGIARDVTERKRSDEALRESERRYRSLAENFPNGALFLFNNRYRFLAANGEAFVRAGLTPEGVVGKTVEEVFPDLWPEMKPYHEALFRGEHVYYEVEFNGRLYSNQGVPITNDKGEFDQAIVITQDITDRRRSEKERASLEDQLRQSQRLEAVGRLAGGVAHDFNNMLQTILGFSDILLEETPARSPARESLEEIRRAAERSADLTRQLLAFARKQTIAPKVLDLNEIVSGMLKMLQRLIGEDIELTWKPAPNLWAVRMDPSQLNQILANLVVNSRDAIGGVGQVVIETDRAEIDEAYCREHGEASVGRYVCLTVSDTGVGMDPETVERIFEPFYTTKPKDRGTGLGLATVYGIVRQNGGFINVYSEPGQGTTFHIYLPAEMDIAEPIDRTSVESLPGGHETILLVEDDPGILKLGTRCLCDLGYRVLPVAGPDDAIAVAKEAGSDGEGGIDLLLTDVVMPGMSGRDLWRELRRTAGTLRCLFMSGYPAEVIAHRGVLDSGLQFIQKPFNAARLAAKVREVLDAPHQSGGKD